MNSETETDAGFRQRLGQLVGDAAPFQWAKAAGVPTSTWNRAWNEGAVPKAPHLVRIALKADVTLDWLLTGEGPMRRTQVQTQAPAPNGAEDHDPDTIADRVRFLRATDPQDRFARTVGLSLKDLQALEAGTSTDRKALETIANGLGFRLDWLLKGEGPPHIRDPRPTAVPDPAPQPAPTAGQPLDGRLLGLCFEGIKRVYRDANARIDDRSAGEMAGHLYAEVQEASAGETDPRRAALRMALRQLRRDVLAVPSASEHGKHSA